MFWSDATHVAQFGQSKLWPVYGYFGNQSKYTRCKPSSRAAHHVAFVELLPDEFQDWLRAKGIHPTSPLLAHCRRELFHKIWELLLDDEFLEVYRHGIVLRCRDGIWRRIYIRIFTYLADYPEKVLIATIRDMGGYCARRTANARQDDEARQASITTARRSIYKYGYVVNSDRVDDELKAESLVPTENAFSKRLSPFRFDLFIMLVVDLMHEFELGVWKALFTHLIRILHSIGSNAVLLFNERFRQIPTFGRSTIRRFAHNVAEMKKLAARDFEDILQCCIPCFDGLLPAPHNDSVATLLYLAAYWHSLAKLRMHTDSSLRVLDRVTVAFGQAIRHFSEVTCKAFDTVETDAEYSARGRADRRRQQKSGSDNSTNAAPSNGKRARTFNLVTFKLHSLGDYSRQIRYFGTTDSYNTQIGELEHRVVKKRHGRGSKKNVVPQLIKLDVAETVHDRMAEELAATSASASDPEPDSNDTTTPQPEGGDLRSHHKIAADESTKLYLGDWVREHRRDPAVINFIPQLKSHLLARILGTAAVGDEPSYEASELNCVQFKSDCIFGHATATFNYTTYDLRRDQDTINVNRDRRDVIVTSNEDANEDGFPAHPFWYARVIGIHHANVLYRGSRKARRMEFLRVPWFGIDPEWVGGALNRRLDRVGFVPEGDESGAFGFLDPAHVLRACHLIPAFALARTTTLLPPSIARDSTQGDWTNYYVNRDMMMRYLGLGVGHLNSIDFRTETDDINPIAEDDYVLPADRIATSDNSGSLAVAAAGADDTEDYYDDDDTLSRSVKPTSTDLRAC
ncbi:hypothetical protein PLICRDRAFT_58395 [Plicaturopsis crispa FD-325 SS-3]|uniref:Uncharacterized protein n=1 Tax=Plicaturopsis crispa FD-325 SS-3 TaxID=944288 RepID=A0A0C9SW24_PLICR|nr:hypothetical protein PLICRDRAFT_58395 [Plicaturopsis crispa FD-325 SS-3]